MKSRGQSPLGFYMIGIAGLFLAGFFLLVLFGAQNYRNTVTGQNDNMKNRALLSYIATVVKAYDSREALKINDSEYGQVLVISDGSRFAMRIYKYQDTLMEDYAVADSPLAPENAQQIGETKRFELNKLSSDVLSVSTDAGKVLLHLRCEEDDAL